MLALKRKRILPLFSHVLGAHGISGPEELKNIRVAYGILHPSSPVLSRAKLSNVAHIFIAGDFGVVLYLFDNGAIHVRVGRENFSVGLSRSALCQLSLIDVRAVNSY